MPLYCSCINFIFCHCVFKLLLRVPTRTLLIIKLLLVTYRSTCTCMMSTVEFIIQIPYILNTCFHEFRKFQKHGLMCA